MSDKDGVQTRHGLYGWNAFSWRSVGDAIEGTNTVKRAAEIYLPMPAGFLVDDTASARMPAHYKSNTNSKNVEYMQSNAPYYHSNPAYMAYLQRARFPEITINTLRGLIGVATRKPIEVKLPEKLGYLEKKATKKGNSLKELFVICLAGVLTKGRVTLVVDIDVKNNKACIVPFVTESFINWNDDDETGENLFSVFEEKTVVYDEFEPEEKIINIVYSKEITDDNKEQVIARKYCDGSIELTKEGAEYVVPTLQGNEFDEVPVVTIGSVYNENDPGPVPLLGISEIAYSIYKKDADLSQAQHMTCNPMFTISGASSDDGGGVPVSFGSTVALLLDNPLAKAYFPETDTSALDHVSSSIQDLFEEASNYGATLLGPTKKAAEAVETVKVRQGAQGATLVGIVENVVKGINDAIEIIAKISGGGSLDNEDEKYIEATTDFAEASLSPQMLSALVGAWQAGAYSKESLIGLLIESGFAKGEVEDEISKIFTEEPSTSGDDE